jgi:hypothetical protein
MEKLPTVDGMAFVFFDCPEAPTKCAMELTEELKNHPEIKLRMGIHCGPIYRVADINARCFGGGGSCQFGCGVIYEITR